MFVNKCLEMSNNNPQNTNNRIEGDCSKCRIMSVQKLEKINFIFSS